MKRVILDAQSNRLFRGSEIEQNYDQRGGLCQVGEGHAVVSTNPIDSEYLLYWKNLGFTIPHLITAGPFDPRHSLSELILEKKELQKEIKAFVNQGPSRLEFFCIGKNEEQVHKALEIPAYCNFNISKRLSRKNAFKKLCHHLSLPTLPYIFFKDKEQLVKEGKKTFLSGVPLIAKATDGMGGISCGGMFRIEEAADIEEIILSPQRREQEFLLERLLTDQSAEIAVYWEITKTGKLNIISFFDIISSDLSYKGVFYPSGISQSLRQEITYQLKDILGDYLIRNRARGYFCCDIIVDAQGNLYWTDFNPRKGATLYIWDMVFRLSEIHFPSVPYCFWHEHLQIFPPDQPRAFDEMTKKISDLLVPGKKPFVAITNPGILRFGYLDMTGISIHSKAEAKEVFEEAKRRLLL